MIEAGLEGKLPNFGDKEDLLTSAVWGLLKYEDVSGIAASYLAGARLVSNLAKPLSASIPTEALRRLEFLFWPNYSGFGEPDLLATGHDLALVIEVKLNADLSGVDQLRRYARLLETHYPKHPQRHVVFLTAHVAPPDLPTESTTGLQDNLWWLSWYDLPAIVRKFEPTTPTAAALRKDLMRVLDHHGLRLFAGFDRDVFPPLNRVFWNAHEPLISKYEATPANGPLFFYDGVPV